MTRLIKTKRLSTTKLFREVRVAEDGFAVVLALMIILIMSILGISLMTVAAYQMMDTDRTKPSNRAFDLADYGLSNGQVYLSKDIPIVVGTPYDSGLKTVDGAVDSKYQFIIYKLLDAYQYKIVSTGTYQAKEGSGTRNYSRTLEEVVKYRGIEGHFDAFTYTLFSKDGNVSLDTGSIGVFTGNGMTVEGNGGHAIYAGGNVTLEDVKRFVAGGKLTVNGDVHAGGNVNISTKSGLLAAAYLNVSGNVIAGGNVTVDSSTACAADSNAQVTGSINAGGNVTLSSAVAFLCHASTKVAQSSNTGVNAKGNVDISAGAAFVAACETYVGTSGATSSVKAMGNSSMTATTGLLAAPTTRVYGSVENNGSAVLSATGFGWQESRIDLVWRHGLEPHTFTGNAYYGSHPGTNPDIKTSDIASVPDVELPVPDWSWYRTMAIAQGNYYDGDKSFSNVTIPNDDSSMWVMYVKGNVTIDNFINNVQKRGVIVSEGDVKVTHAVQLADNTEYQVIAKGNVSHNSFLTLQTGANDKVFIYTDGSYDSNKNGIVDDGNVSYDLGYFRDITGQITCRGNITAPVGSFVSFDQHKIIYSSPGVPVEAWAIPFEVISFKEL